MESNSSALISQGSFDYLFVGGIKQCSKRMVNLGSHFQCMKFGLVSYNDPFSKGWDFKIQPKPLEVKQADHQSRIVYPPIVDEINPSPVFF